MTEAIRAGDVTDLFIAPNAKATEGLRAVLDAATSAGITVQTVERAALDARAPAHQGVLALVREPDVPKELSERDLDVFPFTDDAVVVILDGITDPQNLGAAARAAEVAGVAVLVSRVKRAADLTPAAVRASAGALLHLPHARVANIARAIGRLQDAGFTVVGLDGTAPDDIYGAPCPPGRVAIVLGSEGEGISRLAKERCDVLVSLPVRGKVGSLNASASLAAALYAY
ncbi:MAG: rRNA (guanosine2251-2-O)-methyltransferase, partial [Actinomycetota bacterium]|nr:rRNA (guanosine2251-2-O)-methyltransferase [Actinomycetota bacterium]